VAIPAAVRPLVVRYLNPLTRRVAHRLPGFCVATYRGRTTGRLYRTPLNVFRHGDRYVFALTYGPDVQWVQNVQAAGGCEIETRGRRVALVHPRLERDPAARAMPVPVRQFLRLMGVDRFLWMEEAGTADEADQKHPTDRTNPP
jgi:deazaflavin-dependent oxidoreductase (nitroreductase family)